MKQNIENLWYGNISLAEGCGVHDPEIEKLFRLVERNRVALEKTLDQRQREMFSKYTDCYDEYLCEMSMRAFRDGFCLASQLLTEALSDAS